MGEPRIDYKDPASGVITEILSAISALNMEPSPCTAPPGSPGYLSEVDHWAKHAREHLDAAFWLANTARYGPPTTHADGSASWSDARGPVSGRF